MISIPGNSDINVGNLGSVEKVIWTHVRSGRRLDTNKEESASYKRPSKGPGRKRDIQAFE